MLDWITTFEIGQLNTIYLMQSLSEYRPRGKQPYRNNSVPNSLHLKLIEC